MPTHRGLDRGVKCGAVCAMDGGLQHEDHQDRYCSVMSCYIAIPGQVLQCDVIAIPGQALQHDVIAISYLAVQQF